MTLFSSPWVLWGCSMPCSGQAGGDPWGTEPTWVLPQHLHPAAEPQKEPGVQSWLPRCPHTPGTGRSCNLDPSPPRATQCILKQEMREKPQFPLSSHGSSGPARGVCSLPVIWQPGDPPWCRGVELEAPRSPGRACGLEFRAGVAQGPFLQQMEALLCFQQCCCRCQPCASPVPAQ